MGEQKTVFTLLLILCLVLSTLPLISAAKNSLTTLKPMSTARSGLSVAIVDGKIYAIGGTNGTILGINEMYDPATNTWTTKQSMPTPRKEFGIAVYQNKIYVIGGVWEDNRTRADLTQIYDTENDIWTTGTPMPTSRWALGVAVINDELFVIGGKTEAVDIYSAANEKYTPADFIPGFSLWIILPLLNIVTLFTIVIKKKALHRYSNHKWGS